MARQSVELFDALETAVGDELISRKKAGESRTKIGESLGVKVGLLSQIARRNGDYSMTKLLDVCEALGINVKFDIQ